MISHEHKCIFIHISKCAGSSIETAFGIDVRNNGDSNHENLFGWSDTDKIYLQHATPQQLFNNGYVSEKLWNDYYKFVIVRNPWSRAYSDYVWLKSDSKISGSFKDFLMKKGDYFQIMNFCDRQYRGDHLKKQIDYFFLDGKRINYNCVIRFEKLQDGLNKVIKDLSLSQSFFDVKINSSKKKLSHYSFFYNPKRKKLVEKLYKEDADFLDYSFDDRKSFLQSVLCFKPSPYYL